jgi:hypothetical protein
VSISGTPQKPVLDCLASGERIGGGKAVLYYTGGLIKLTNMGRAKALSSDSEYGIDASRVEALLVKSKSASNGRSRSIIFAPEYGYLDELSTLDYLLQNNLINGTTKLSFEGSPIEKFSKKDFLGLINTRPDFKEAFHKFADNILIKSVYETTLAQPSAKRFFGDDDEDEEVEVPTTPIEINLSTESETVVE